MAPIVLDFGSGPWPKPDATIHMDFNDFPHVEIRHDLLNIPYPFPSDYADKIYLHDVVEHISVFDIGGVLKECHRILKEGGELDITCPDVMWIVERLYKGDWKEKAKGDWLNKYPNDFCNAMSYLFGGFYSREEYNKKGMGHVAGYSREQLMKTLAVAIRPFDWKTLVPVSDTRNECILRVVAWK